MGTGPRKVALAKIISWSSEMRDQEGKENPSQGECSGQKAQQEQRTTRVAGTQRAMMRLTYPLPPEKQEADDIESC